MIELQNVSKVYHNNGISTIGIHNVSLKFNKGEIVAIVGESGSGKSTLINVISKIDSFDEGEILYKGNGTAYFDVCDMDDFRKNKVGFIFQNYNILDSYTVLENVMLPLILKGKSDEEAKKEALRLINRVGLTSRANSRGSRLSGGEKQRCVIARALASDCEILACDEPTGNLDSETAKQIIELIMEVATDKLVLIVTHNFNEVKDYCTRQIVMADGKVVEDIPLKDVNKDNDENEVLNLDYEKLPSKATSKIAKNNILFTPNKSLLLFLIISIISLAFLFVVQFLSVELNYTFVDSAYRNLEQNYCVVYNHLHNSIDTSKLNNLDYDVNSFSSQNTFYTEVGDFSSASIYANKVDSYKLLEGTLPVNDDEFMIVVSPTESYYLEQAKAAVGKTLNVSTGYYYDCVTYTTSFKLVGVATGSNYSQLYTYLVGSDTIRTFLDNSVINISASYTYNNETNTLSVIKENTNNSTAIIMPKSYEANKDNITYSCVVEDIYDYSNISIIYDQECSAPYLRVGLQTQNDLPAYFAFVNVNAEEVSSLKVALALNNIDVTYPPTDGDNNGLQALITEIIAFFSSINMSFYLVGVFFISYFILSRVYQSRIKDYEIIRTLGVTKKDMSKIVLKEVLGISFTSIVFSFILYIILSNTVAELYCYRKFNISTILLYFVMMGLFAFFTARRFNVKLFKFTIRKSIKGGNL